MAAHLEDWEIRVDRQGVEKMSFGMTDNPFQDDEATTFGFMFTTRSRGGCSSATINVMGQLDTYVAGLDLLPDDRLLIRLQCGAENSLIDRYVGAVKQVDLAWGTDPKVRKIQAAGFFGQFRKVPLFAFYNDKTIQELVQAVIADLATKSDVTSYAAYITHGADYTVALTDFMDLYGDRALKRLSKLAGADTVWGIVPGDSGTPTDARFFFQPLGSTAADPGFEVGANIEDAEGTLSRARFLNGMLVGCQRKISGGNLWLYVPPPEGTIPWRVGKLRVPEVVEPADAYHYAETVIQGFPDTDTQIKFTAPNFGEQIWANEIINSALAVKMQKGGSATEVFVQEVTVSVDENGSVDSAFTLGTMPDLQLMHSWGDLVRDQVVAEAGEFWSGVELMARDSDVIRGWRRDAAKEHGIRNFWAANLDNIEAILSNNAWADGGYEEPTGFHDFGWNYNPDAQRVKGTESQGSVCCVPIPTGLTAGAAIVYLKLAGADYHQNHEEHWDVMMTTDPNGQWYWANDWWGICPKLLSMPSNVWRGAVSCIYKFSSGVPEQPIKVRCGPMDPLFDTTNPTTYGNMKALSHYIDVVFAGSTHSTTTNGYCLRVHRRSGESSGIAKCALGWVSNGTFHSDWWAGGATPDSQAVGQFNLGNDKGVGSGAHSFECDVWLPTSGGSGDFRVRVRKNQTAEVLWDSNTIHGAGAVSGSAPDPAGRHFAQVVWYEADPETTNYAPFGLKGVAIESPGGLNIAVTRDGEFWTIGAPEVLLTLFGDTYLDAERKIMFSVDLGEGNSIGSWGVGFLHETPDWEMTWDQNYGDDGTGDGEFREPRDCTVDSDYIYVTDYNNDRVQILTNDDPPVFSAKFGTGGTGDGQFDLPWGIDKDDTYLYVADSGNKRVSVFLKASPYTWIRHIGAGTLTHNSYGVTVEGRTYAATDRLYVCCDDGYVWIFQKDGTYVDKFEPFTDASPPNNRPEDVCVSGDENHLYITSPGGSAVDDPTNRIIKVKRQSPYTRIWSWGQRGLDPPNGKWEWPWSIARLGDCLIVSSGSNAVYVTKNYLTILADRGTYAEYLDHETGAGGESGAGFLQPYAGDIRDNIFYMMAASYCQLKRFILS